MKPSEMFDVLDLAKRARDKGKIFNPLFVSPPGLGKTEIVEQWCKKNGYGYIPFSLATSDAPDFKGFPLIKEVNGKSRMSFATPDIWPDSGKHVIVLEELNRTTQATMQCVLSVGDKRRGFDGYTLPPEVIVVGCVNPDDGYDTTAMDPALKDRFEIFNVTYDRQSHVAYMKATEYDARIINFVEAGRWEYKEPNALGNVPGTKYISPRTISKLDAALAANLSAHMERAVYEEILGINIGKDFYNFCHDESPVTMFDLRSNKQHSLNKLAKFGDPAKYQNGMISLTVKDIIEDNTIENDLLCEVLLVLPVEQVKTLIVGIEMKRKLTADSLLKQLMTENKKVLKHCKETVNYGK
jgi:hypothetical protein